MAAMVPTVGHPPGAVAVGTRHRIHHPPGMETATGDASSASAGDRNTRADTAGAPAVRPDPRRERDATDGRAMPRPTSGPRRAPFRHRAGGPRMHGPGRTEVEPCLHVRSRHRAAVPGATAVGVRAVARTMTPRAARCAPSPVAGSDPGHVVRRPSGTAAKPVRPHRVDRCESGRSPAASLRSARRTSRERDPPRAGRSGPGRSSRRPIPTTPRGRPRREVPAAPGAGSGAGRRNPRGAAPAGGGAGACGGARIRSLRASGGGARGAADGPEGRSGRGAGGAA